MMIPDSRINSCEKKQSGICTHKDRDTGNKFGFVYCMNLVRFGGFHRNTAFRLYPRVPITGMLKRIDGEAGILSCIDESGNRQHIPVLVSELIPAGGFHVAE